MIKRPWIFMLLGWLATKYGPRVANGAARRASASAARRSATGARGARTTGAFAKILNSPTARKGAAMAFAWFLAKRSRGRTR